MSLSQGGLRERVSEREREREREKEREREVSKAYGIKKRKIKI